LKIQGEISGQCLRETELCWLTAASTIGDREFIVEVAGAPREAEAGKGLFRKMYQAGARLVAATPAAAALIAEITGETPAPPAVQAPGALPAVRRWFAAAALLHRL
jgi:hypothetical protein